MLFYFSVYSFKRVFNFRCTLFYLPFTIWFMANWRQRALLANTLAMPPTPKTPLPPSPFPLHPWMWINSSPFAHPLLATLPRLTSVVGRLSGSCPSKYTYTYNYGSLTCFFSAKSTPINVNVNYKTGNWQREKLKLEAALWMSFIIILSTIHIQL